MNNFSTLPDWLNSEGALSPAIVGDGAKARNSVVEKSLAKVALYLKATAEPVAGKNVGAGLDPRARIGGLLVLAVAAGLATRLDALVVFFLLAIIVSALLQVGPVVLLKRVLLPFVFTTVIAFPSVFAFFTPGSELFAFGIGPLNFAITAEGARTALTLLVRVLAMSGLVLLIFASTLRSDLFKGLSGLGVPRFFVTALHMTFRYLFVLLKLFTDTMLALRSRTIIIRGVSGKKAEGRRQARSYYASRAAFFLDRSLSIADEVGMAMSSRGFSGNFKNLCDYKLRSRDYLWLCFSFFVFFLSLAF